MLKMFAISLVAAGLMSTGALAQRQLQCDDRDSVVDVLSKKYSEVTVAAGVTDTGRLIEVLTTTSGDTWTIIITSPEGTSCLVAAGEGWRGKTEINLDPEA